MEGMFIWIVIFAGAANALLAVFLVASEKELKKKRLEIDELLVKVGTTSGSESVPAPAPMVSPMSNEELDQLRARNQELENELASVASKFESGSTLDAELELAQRNVEIAKSNAQWLQTANDELKAEVEELKRRLTASAAGSVESMSPGHGATNGEGVLESEIANLHQQLAASQAKIREFDGLEQKIADMNATETRYHEEKRVLEARITELELENAVSAGHANQANELDSLRQRLAESERIHQTLREERQGFVQEIARWQAQASQAEEKSRRLMALQEPFAQLLAKLNAVGERQRECQEAMVKFSHMIAAANSSPQSAAGFNEFHATASVAAPARASQAPVTLDAGSVVNAPAQIVAAAQTTQKSKRRFGLFPAIILVISVSAIAAGLWGLKASDTTPTVTASSLPPPAQNQTPTLAASADKPAAAVVDETPPPAPAPAAKEMDKSSAKEKLPAVKAISTAKAQQPITGTYEITQTSRVYAGPSELSQSIGDIEPGVRVDVVNAKNGWLEIHSKHGRPPGFIRKEGARVLARN